MGTMPPSSRGLGHHPFKVKTRIRIPLGVLTRWCRDSQSPAPSFMEPGARFCLPGLEVSIRPLLCYNIRWDKPQSAMTCHQQYGIEKKSWGDFLLATNLARTYAISLSLLMSIMVKPH